MPMPPSLLAPLVEEFYEAGLMNIINVIPRDYPNDDRLFIEAVTYTGYGFFRSYARLEALLDSATDEQGSITALTPAMNRDIFTNAWQCVDSAYALSQIFKTAPAKRFPKATSEMREGFYAASRLRNYMDHLKDNFKNISIAKGWFPLFGWITAQFTPYFRDDSLPKNITHILNVSSTHIEGTVTINGQEHISGSVFSHLDNIKIHAKKGDSLNLSKLLLDIAVGLNHFSIFTQHHLTQHIEEYTGPEGGIRKAWSILTVCAEFHDMEIDRSTIEYLKDNKVRIEWNLDATNDEK